MAKAQAAAATQTTTPTGPATSARASDTSAQGPNAATKADLDQASDTPASSPSPGTIGEEEIRVRAYLLWEQRGCPIGEPEVDWLLAEELLLLPPE